MVATTVKSPGGPAGPLAAWRDAVAEAVAPACSEGASVWERNRAVRELERVFVPRFRVERARIEQAAVELDHPTRERLWAAGELLDRLRALLEEDARIPFRGATFAAELTALLRGLDHWCEEAERAATLLPRA